MVYPPPPKFFVQSGHGVDLIFFSLKQTRLNGDFCFPPPAINLRFLLLIVGRLLIGFHYDAVLALGKLTLAKAQ